METRKGKVPCSRLIERLPLRADSRGREMRNLLPLKKIGFGLILLIIGYHVIFSNIRFFIDFWYPMGWYDNTIVAFGEQLRIGILHEISPQNPTIWYMEDLQPEKQVHPKSGFIGTMLDESVYDYEVEMGWFYQYKTFYAYGRNGFWIIQADPFHIKLLRSLNIPEEDDQKLDETIAGYNCYGDQFTVVNSESDLTREEQKAYARVKEKAQPRIEKLKAQGLFP